MANKFSQLRANMSPEAQAMARAKTEELIAEMPLQELRLARTLSQKAIAEVLHVSQARVSKMEKRTDMYLSTLRTHIEAMGGSLDLIANFPEGKVKITNLDEHAHV
ncbi:XRE family transcriptional regulator [Halomonas sp. AOP42-A1-22]|uniref:XRE family transcriptional regulator n=1 Tax=Halomonas sp. AOP42-A1-22 TaxID=3457674 RepID=UPI004033B1B8